MATNTDPIFPKSVAQTGITFLPADTTVAKTFITAPADGQNVASISVTSTDTSAVILVLTLNDGSADFIIGEVTIPIGAGTDGSTPAVNLLSIGAMPFFQADGSMVLEGTWLLKINAKTTITSAKQIDLVAFGGDYAA